MKIYIASDHAGFELKKALIEYLKSKDIDVEDCGAKSLDPVDDFPDFIIPCALRVAQGKLHETFGIVIGGSGQGEAIAANKVKGITAAIYYGGDLDIVRLSKEHNDANILSLGARFLTSEAAKEAVLLWLGAKLNPDPKYKRRIDKIKAYEEQNH